MHRRYRRVVIILLTGLLSLGIVVGCGSDSVDESNQSDEANHGGEADAGGDTNGDNDGDTDGDNDSDGDVTVTILSGPQELTSDTTAEFEISCDADECDYQCSLNGADMQPCSTPAVYEELDDGDHDFEVIALSEGMESEPDRWQWSIDTEAPVIDILSAPPEETDQEDATFEFECANKPQCTFECALEADDGNQVVSGDWESCDSPHSETLPSDGDYTLRIRATDEAGNEAIETVEWSLFIKDWVMLDTGNHHSCAIDVDQTLWCWGDNYYGQLGLGDYQNHDTPQQVEAGTNLETGWTSLSVGNWHTCATRQDQSLWCWGNGGTGRLGLGTNSNRNSPRQVESSSALETGWTSVSSGGWHTCATRDDDTLWCWGSGSYNTLGLDDQDNRYSPAQVAENTPQETGWTSVSASGSHTCAIGDDETLWCWGHNVSGRLGLGDTTTRSIPHQVEEGTPIENGWDTVSSGDTHTCAIRDDDTLWCWGKGNSGRLGLGNVNDQYTPQQVAEGSPQEFGWRSLATGTFHTCGVRKDRTLWCWGKGDHGQLGLGDTDMVDTPHEVEADPGAEIDWLAISSSRNDHNCALSTDYRFWCWGLGEDGQLGLGDNDDRDEPREVTIP